MIITCFGDSNTHGWDPRCFSNNKYAKAWPDILTELTGYETINLGVPGREIPHSERFYEYFHREIGQHTFDRLLIMLGTNDVLNQLRPSAEEPMERMKGFVEEILSKGYQPKQLILVAPPQMEMPDPTYNFAMLKFAFELQTFAEEKGITFLDATAWEIPLAYDGVHFTEDAHRIFAEKIKENLPPL